MAQFHRQALNYALIQELLNPRCPPLSSGPMSLPESSDRNLVIIASCCFAGHVPGTTCELRLCSAASVVRDICIRRVPKRHISK